MAVSRDEIFARISEIGKTAGNSSGESLTALQQLLILLNGSGLVASLAFIGTILTSRITLKFMPFYWSTVCFGIGIAACLIDLLTNSYYFSLAVKKYKKNYLERDPTELMQLAPLINLLKMLAEPTKGQIICSDIGKYARFLSVLMFVFGLSSGFLNLYFLYNHFPTTK